VNRWECGQPVSYERTAAHGSGIAEGMGAVPGRDGDLTGRWLRLPGHPALNQE